MPYKASDFEEAGILRLLVSQNMGVFQSSLALIEPPLAKLRILVARDQLLILPRADSAALTHVFHSLRLNRLYARNDKERKLDWHGEMVQ